MMLHLFRHSEAMTEAFLPGNRALKIQVNIGAIIPNSFSTVRFLIRHSRFRRNRAALRLARRRQSRLRYSYTRSRVARSYPREPGAGDTDALLRGGNRHPGSSTRWHPGRYPFAAD